MRAIDGATWTRVRTYREAASAGTVEGRVEFERMIAELANTKPAAIVVDTLDRFTRNLREGLNLLEELRGHHVGLIALDWRRDRPIDLDDDRDWADVVAEFTQAEAFRRKLSRTIRRSYEARGERGATKTNKPPFGLVKVGDQLVPDPDRAWIVAEVDRRLLAGESMGELNSWSRSIDPAAWQTRTGVMLAMSNTAYVEAGVRKVQTQAALNSLLATNSARFGLTRRKYELEFTGVFRCECGQLMHSAGVMINGVPRERIICDRRNRAERGHCVFVYAERVAPLWARYTEEISAPGAVERWTTAATVARPERRKLEHRLAAIDQKAAALKERRDAALDLMLDKNPGVVRQVRTALAELDRDESALWASREAVLGELASLDAPTHDVVALAALLPRYGEMYETMAPRDRNILNRALCAALGSHPVLRRLTLGGRGSGKKATYGLDWPGVSATKSRRPSAAGGHHARR